MAKKKITLQEEKRRETLQNKIETLQQEARTEREFRNARIIGEYNERRNNLKATESKMKIIYDLMDKYGMSYNAIYKIAVKY